MRIAGYTTTKGKRHLTLSLGLFLQIEKDDLPLSSQHDSREDSSGVDAQPPC